MDELQTLRGALGDVPRSLLTSDEQRVLADVATSLDVAEQSGETLPLVVLVGPSGVGKSFLFNRIVGSDASSEGVLRPTTVSTVVSGDGHEPYLKNRGDYIIVPAAGTGFDLADTQGWEHDPERVNNLKPFADLFVVVVSPSRYADETVANLRTDLTESSTLVVVNRMNASGRQRTTLLESVTGIFGSDPFVVDEGDMTPSGLEERIRLEVTSGRATTMRSIMVRSALAGTRFIVRAVTNAAPKIGKVRLAIDGLPESTHDQWTYDVQASWSGTRDRIVERVGVEVSDRDAKILSNANTDLGRRILDDIGTWDESVLAAQLDDWRDRCIAGFEEAASIRWRRTSAKQLIERFSWMSSISSDVVTPKRFTRIMGDQLAKRRQAFRSDLQSLMSVSVQARTTAWIGVLDELGSFQPARLLTAGDALIEGQENDV